MGRPHRPSDPNASSRMKRHRTHRSCVRVVAQSRSMSRSRAFAPSRSRSLKRSSASAPKRGFRRVARDSRRVCFPSPHRHRGVALSLGHGGDPPPIAACTAARRRAIPRCIAASTSAGVGPVEQRGQTAGPADARLDSPRRALAVGFPADAVRVPLYQAYRACSGATAAGEAQAGFSAAPSPRPRARARRARRRPRGRPRWPSSCAILGAAHQRRRRRRRVRASRGAPRARGAKMDAPARQRLRAERDGGHPARAGARAARLRGGDQTRVRRRALEKARQPRRLLRRRRVGIGAVLRRLRAVGALRGRVVRHVRVGVVRGVSVPRLRRGGGAGAVPLLGDGAVGALRQPGGDGARPAT